MATEAAATNTDSTEVGEATPDTEFDAATDPDASNGGSNVAVASDEPVVEPGGPVLIVTDEAAKMVAELQSEEDDAEALGLRLEVTGAQGVEYAYDLSFEAVSECSTGYNVEDSNGLMVMIPDDSVELLRGATLDLPSTSSQGGLVIRNPNRPDPLAGLDLELTGDISEKVTQLLDAVINPGLAAHGGFTTLVGVDDTKVYLSMGGGCQGCSMSAMTMTEGIRTQLMEVIPEITEVIDSTDHSAGESPFYA